MKKTSILALTCLVVIIIIFVVFLMKDTVYTVSEVFENADFNTENQSVSIESVNTKTEDIFTSIEIPEEKQKELINALENAEFKKTDFSSEWDYLVNITLNTGYDFYVVSDKGIIVPIDKEEAYIITNDNDFFNIIKEVTE